MESFQLLFKSLHIVGFVAWFGGLFYLVRILVYHREALDKDEHEQRVLIPQYQLMESRVYRIICNPGMMITWTFGLLMLYNLGGEWLRTQPWMHVKLTLLVLLTLYHLNLKSRMRKLGAGDSSMSSFGYRLWNEIPTLFLLAIVLLAVYRNMLDFGKAFVGIFAFGIILYGFARWYKTSRKQ